MLPLAMATNCGKTREHKLDEQPPLRSLLPSPTPLLPHDSQLITAISRARQAGTWNKVALLYNVKRNIQREGKTKTITKHLITW